MAEETSGESLRDRISNMGEETLGRLAQELLENPAVNAAIGRVMDAREKAVQAQQVAMGALNIPSAVRHRAPHPARQVGLAAPRGHRRRRRQARRSVQGRSPQAASTSGWPRSRSSSPW